MSVLPILFGAPALLFGLIALPIIWWLLRLTPPRPKSEIFPPLRILARVLKKQETPSKSPWWLTALRLLIAALIVIALAQPVLNPRSTQANASGPLVLVMDNGWSTAEDWQKRIAVANGLIDDAEAENIPVSIVFTAENAHNATPDTPGKARERLQAAAPRPLNSTPKKALASIRTALAGQKVGTLAILSSGLAQGDSDADWQGLVAMDPADIYLFENTTTNTIALNAAENEANGFAIRATRLHDRGNETRTIAANDGQGRPIAKGELIFEAGSLRWQGTADCPLRIAQ